MPFYPKRIWKNGFYSLKAFKASSGNLCIIK